MAINVRVPPLTVAPSTVVGGTPQSVFTFQFPFWEAADIIVEIDGEALDPADYAVVGLFIQLDENDEEIEVEGGYGSGQVTLDTPVSDCTVTIDRFVTAARETVFSKTAPLPMTALNADLNKLTARDQDLARRFGISTGGGGGDGGPFDISDITGLETALDGKAATSHTQAASTITDFSEAVDDRVAAAVVDGTGLTATYNDGAGSLTLDVDFATWTEVQTGAATGKAIDPLTAASGMPVVYRDVICDAAPSPANADDSGGILAMFDGEQSYNPIRLRSRLRAQSALSAPTSGYRYTPETALIRGWLFNRAGHNQSTSTNDGRTGAVAMRLNITATSGSSPTVSKADGDTVAYNFSAFCNAAEKSGSTHFLANPAIVGFNGDMLLGADYGYMQGAEVAYDDGGFVGACIHDVANLKRTNAGTDKAVTWIAYRPQSTGTQAIDSFFAPVGSAKIGMDLSTGSYTQAAIALAADQTIHFDATNATSDKFPDDTTVGSTYLKFNGTSDAYEFWVAGSKTAEIGANGVTAANQFLRGTGSPEGAVTANRGTIYVQTDGAVGSTLWAKRTDGTNTSWETLGSQPTRAITAKAGIILDDLQILTGRVSGTIRNLLNYSASGTLTFGDAAAGGPIAFFNDFIPDVASGAKFIGSTSNRVDTIYTINALNVLSDAREKTERPAPPKLLAEIGKLRMRTYTRNDGGKVRCGVFAQDVIACFERASVDWREWDVVHEDKSGKLSVYYDHLFALKIAALELALA